MKGLGRVTIYDVAREAGVSRATVSRVMNGLSTVDPELVARVQRAAAALNYQPSRVARSLSLGTTQTVAVLIPELSNPMFHNVLSGFAEAAEEDGYRVLIAENGGDPEVEVRAALDARSRCDGILLVAPRASDDVLAPLLPQLQPAVVLGRPPADRFATPGLSIDYAAGMRAAIEHLVELGHSDIVYLAGPSVSVSNRARLAGIEQAMVDHPRLRIVPVHAGAAMTDGQAAMGRVLATGASAVIAYNDLVAFGLLVALDRAGARVPQDLSVVGFDDVDLARFATPALTTLSVPHHHLGRRAWQQFPWHDHRAAAGAVNEPVVPRLVVRESTGPAPALKSGRRPRRTSPGTVSSLRWVSDGDADVLLGDGAELLRYESGRSVPVIHSRRPFAHPIRSLGGRTLTQISPDDHRHQYGLSVAIAEVNGTSFWGGRTFVRGIGSTLLANHGRQDVVHRQPWGMLPPDRAILDERVEWRDEDGGLLLVEDRRWVAVLAPAHGGWYLGLRSTLQPVGEPVTLSSPAVSGRTGAGYGGIFWRFGQNVVPQVASPAGEGDLAIHGTTADWCLFSTGPGDQETSVVIVQPGDLRLPWFCRAADYTGIGPAVAWQEARRIEMGESLVLTFGAAIVDRVLTRHDPLTGEIAAAAVAQLDEVLATGHLAAGPVQR